MLRKKMSWDGKQGRWVKMYKGQRFTIACSVLGVPATKEGSCRAANSWWTAKQAEIDAAYAWGLRNPSTTKTTNTTFELILESVGIADPLPEYRFVPSRRWRFDYAWPERKLALEIEGGVWSGGRHVRPRGYERDCEKYNEAALLGWRVLRVTTDMVQDGRALTLLERCFRD